MATEEICPVRGCWRPKNHGGFHGANDPSTPIVCECSRPAAGWMPGDDECRRCRRVIAERVIDQRETAKLLRDAGLEP